MVKTGPSRGCGTCRRRKVKCDERKPHCERCERGRMPCEGYNKVFRWVNESKRSSPPRRSDYRTSLPNRSQNTDQHSWIARFIHQIRRGPSPYNHDAYIGFTIKQLFPGAPCDQEYSYQSWIKQTLKSPSNSIAYLAFESLAAACFGRMHGPDQKIMEQARKLYGQVLVKLKDAIEDPRTCYDRCNVSATMALHLYETLCYTSGSGWIQHAGGAGRLIELRGPERHQESPDHGYFTLMRPRIIIQAIVSRKRTFLEREEWMTVPWKYHAETRTPHQQLLDIMCPVPGILEDYNAAKSISHDEEDLRAFCKRFIPKLQSLLERLFRWRWHWETTNPYVVSETPIDPNTTWMVHANGKAVFHTVFHFPSLTLAHEINLYTTTLMFLQHSLRTVQGSHEDTDTMRAALEVSLFDRDGNPPRKTNPLMLPHEHITPVDMANDTVRCVDYYLQEKHANQGAFSLLFPLRMCVLAYSLAGDQEMLRWLVGLQKMCANQSAFELSRHMSKLSRLGTTAKIEGLDDHVSLKVLETIEEANKDLHSGNISPGARGLKDCASASS